tara:strand:- start:252 stop:416 length:165 start_codon:yes stop_codon:yes gene_type:complete
MIRLIILFAIFLAVYPMIGDGWEAFSQDFNIDAITNFVQSAFNGITETIDKIQE